MYSSFLFDCKTAEKCLDKILTIVGPIDWPVRCESKHVLNILILSGRCMSSGIPDLYLADNYGDSKTCLILLDKIYRVLGPTVRTKWMNQSNQGGFFLRID